VCIVGDNGHMFLGWGGGGAKWSISNFKSFRVNVDVMLVYVLGGGGSMPSCFWRFVLFDIMW
jgi:hypothetical protein